jgi:hypothetical protein
MATYILTAAQLNNRILNSFSIPSSGGPVIIVDANAQAFITAAGITDPTQQAAIDNLVIGLKADGLWTNMNAIYPFVGGTATTHKYNLKDPRDLDAAYRLQFNGGITHSSTGATPSGVNTYAETFFNPRALSDTSFHYSAYWRTLPTGIYWDIGAEYFQGNEEEFYNVGAQYIECANTSLRCYNGLGSSPTITVGNEIGNYISSRINSVDHQLYKNGTLLATAANTPGNPNDFVLMGYKRTFSFGDPVYFSGKKQIAFSTIGSGLTSTQATNLYNRIQTFQTTLNRQV